MKWTLEGKTALITGATKGIGKAIVEEFLKLGASVYLVGRNEKTLADAMVEFNRFSERLDGSVADLSIPGDRNELVSKVAGKWGKLDVLVNNVGTNIRKKSHEYTDEEVEFIFQTNLKSAYDLSRNCHHYQYFICCRIDQPENRFGVRHDQGSHGSDD